MRQLSQLSLGVGTAGYVRFIGAGRSLARPYPCRKLLTHQTPADHALFYRQDAQIAGQATGAMSFAFIAALKKNPQQSYVQLLNSLRDELEGKYTQKPQLSCSHPLDTNLLYVM